MTDFVLQANETSTLLRDLNSKERVDLSYATKPSYPILSKKFFSIASDNTLGANPAGSTVVFKLPRAGLLRHLLIRSNVTTAAALVAGTYAQPWGLNLFESIEIRTNNKVIYVQSDAATRSLSQHAPLAESQAIFRRAMATASTSGALAADASTTFTVYTPVFGPFFESIYNNVDLNFWEPISVHCKIADADRMGLLGVAGGGARTSITALTSTMWIWTYTPDIEYYNKLKAKNMTPGYPLNMLGYNTFLEKFTCTSTTQNVMRLNINYPVTGMYFFVKHINSGALFTIDSFTFAVAGSNLLESIPWLVADYECDVSGSTGLTVTNATAVSRFTDINRVRWLQFNMDPYDRTYNSGAMSFNNLLSPTLTINTQDLTTASNYEIHVVYVYQNIISFDSTNGQVMVSNST